jgi:hypothetical protein
MGWGIGNLILLAEGKHNSDLHSSPKEINVSIAFAIDSRVAFG